jgi:uncharacterized protein
MHLYAHVGPLLDPLGASTDVDSALALGIITMGECVFEPLSPAKVHVTLSNTGAGIVASGTATVDVRTTCVRCLRAFEMETTGDVQGFYVLPGHEAGLPEEQEVELISENRIDLAPAVLAAIVVDLPFAPVHSEDCAGLCPLCGTDRNEAPCSCETQGEESAFAGLRSLLEPPEDVGTG